MIDDAALCLDEDALLALVEARLGPDDRRRAEQHLDRCSDCRLVVAALARHAGSEEEDGSITDVARKVEDALPDDLALRFELLRWLGTGPHGSLFAARDRATRELCAVKWLHAGWIKEPGALDRVKTAIERAATLRHPNIARAFDSYTSGDVVIVVGELVEGTSVDNLIASGGMTPTLAREVVAQMVAAIGEAHRAGVCHGAVRPENVVVDLAGHARVTDFGLRGALRGGLPNLEAGGARADVAALSALGIELLDRARHEPSALRTILEFALDDPAAFASGVELANAVATAIGPLPLSASRLLEDGQSWVPAPGELIAGKYRVEGVIGSGGMGAVVAAVHADLGRRVAVKLMPPRAAKRPLAVERFLREARTASVIESDHVVSIFDVGRTETGAPYLVMEYLVGSTLGQMIARRGALPQAEVLDYVLQVCVAVAECHGRGIIHRDLKPENVMVLEGPGQRGTVKVLDFGISKADWSHEPDAELHLTRTSELVGTPTHMSPEQVRSSKDVDHRTDIWSLGVILFELLTGQPPFNARSVTALSAMIVSDDPPHPRALRPDIPPRLADVVLACLAKAPESRPSDVLALAEELTPFAAPASRILVEHIRDLAASPPRADRPSSIPAPRSAPPLSIPMPTVRAEESAELERRVTSRAMLVGAAVGAAVFAAASLLWLLFWPAPPPATLERSAIAAPPVIVIAPAPNEARPARATARAREPKDRDGGGHAASYRSGGPLDDRR